MQLDLSNIQEVVIPFGYHTGKKVKEVPAKWFQEMRDKAPNKRTLTEKLLLQFVNDENDKYNLINNVSGSIITLKINGKEVANDEESIFEHLSGILGVSKQKKLNKLLSTNKA